MNPAMVASTPAWAQWRGPAEGGPYTLGVEEEVMLLDPDQWSLAHRIETVLPRMSRALSEHVTAETHGSAIELATGVQSGVAGIAAELGDLRRRLDDELSELGVAVAAAGTHPFAVWQDTVVSRGERYQFLYGSMRELARREPTFALHVHVGVDDPEDAIRLFNRLRGYIPLLLALSANSPFWQGRDTGLASARTPLFGAFPRVGLPRAFSSYEEYVETVDLLIRCDAFPEPTFLWWDVRPQPRFGTIEIRVMDSQITVDDTAALVALVQCIARLEIEEGYCPTRLLDSPEVLHENRFLAARDGVNAAFIDPAAELRVPLALGLERLLNACRPHAQDLGCEAELLAVRALAAENGALRQLARAREHTRLPGLVCELARVFAPSPAG